MLKLILIGILIFGAFIGLCIFVPTSWDTAFMVRGSKIPWIALGVALVGYVGWKKIS